MHVSALSDRGCSAITVSTVRTGYPALSLIDDHLASNRFRRQYFTQPIEMYRSAPTVRFFQTKGR